MRLIPYVRSAGSKLAPWVTTRGHFEYELQHSRDNRYPVNPNFKYDTFSRFFRHGWKKFPETYALMAFCGTACAFALYTIYWSFGKPDIWLNRAHHDPPWDWSRCRTSYWHNNARMFYIDADDKELLHRRKPIMETLNDELLEAAIARGTRNPDGSTKYNRGPQAHH